MKRSTKIWLITATSLILIGCILFVGVMTVLKWDFSKLSNVKYETNHYEITETFQNLSIITKSADVQLLPADDDKVLVACYEAVNMKHTAMVKDETLCIELNDERRWYEQIGFHFSNAKIKVYLPEKHYNLLKVQLTTGDFEILDSFVFEDMSISQTTGNVKNYASVNQEMSIRITTGDIWLSNASAKSIDFSVTTGDIVVNSCHFNEQVKMALRTGDLQLTNISCGTFSTTGTTGDVLLTDTVVNGKMDVKRTTGDVSMRGCDAAELYIHTTTGKVTGTLLSDKVFMAKSTTSSVNVPKTVNGGLCEITTTTGKIEMQVVS